MTVTTGITDHSNVIITAEMAVLPGRRYKRPRVWFIRERLASARSELDHEVTRKKEPVASRLLYQDIKPYDVPASLGALRGPSSGMLTLPLDVYWGPDPDADLDTLSGVTKAYQAILREGSSGVQKALLNRDVLRRTWDELLLPVRLRSLWESPFPELAA